MICLLQKPRTGKFANSNTFFANLQKIADSETVFADFEKRIISLSLFVSIANLLQHLCCPRFGDGQLIAAVSRSRGREEGLGIVGEGHSATSIGENTVELPPVGKRRIVGYGAAEHRLPLAILRVSHMSIVNPNFFNYSFTLSSGISGCCTDSGSPSCER